MINQIKKISLSACLLGVLALTGLPSGFAEKATMRDLTVDAHMMLTGIFERGIFSASRGGVDAAVTPAVGTSPAMFNTGLLPATAGMKTSEDKR